MPSRSSSGRADSAIIAGTPFKDAYVPNRHPAIQSNSKLQFSAATVH